MSFGCLQGPSLSFSISFSSMISDENGVTFNSIGLLPGGKFILIFPPSCGIFTINDLLTCFRSKHTYDVDATIPQMVRNCLQKFKWYQLNVAADTQFIWYFKYQLPTYHKANYRKIKCQCHFVHNEFFFFLFSKILCRQIKFTKSTWQELKLNLLNLKKKEKIHHSPYTLETWLIIYY